MSADAGAIPVLVALVRDGSPKQTESSRRRTAALYHLAFTAQNRVAIAEAGGIPVLVALASQGTTLQKEKAASALSNLALNAGNQVLIVVLLRVGHLINVVAAYG